MQEHWQQAEYMHVPKAVEGAGWYNLMKWNIIACLFTKLDVFLPFVIYMV